MESINSNGGGGVPSNGNGNSTMCLKLVGMGAGARQGSRGNDAPPLIKLDAESLPVTIGRTAGSKISRTTVSRVSAIRPRDPLCQHRRVQ